MNETEQQDSEPKPEYLRRALLLARSNGTGMLTLGSVHCGRDFIRALAAARRSALVLLAGCILQSAHAAPLYCDPKIPQGHEDDAYKERGDRCEGFFYRPTSAETPTINIISFLSSSTLSLPAGKSWRIAFAPTKDGVISIRAETLPETNLYYRMDTRVPGTAGGFLWDTRLLNGKGISSFDFGLVAWSDPERVADAARAIVPLHFAANDKESTPKATSLIVFLKLAQAVDHLAVHVYEVTGAGRMGALMESEDLTGTIPQPSAGLAHGVPEFSPNRTIGPITLRSPPRAGVYSLEIVGTWLRDGSSDQPAGTSKEWKFIVP